MITSLRPRPRRRRRALPIIEEKPLPTLDETLADLARIPAFIHFDADRGFDIWSPQRRVPLPVRRVLCKNQVEVVAALLAGDMRLCPSPELHQRHLRARDRRAGRCTVCVRLLPSVFNPGNQIEEQEQERQEEAKAS